MTSLPLGRTLILTPFLRYLEERGGAPHRILMPGGQTLPQLMRASDLLPSHTLGLAAEALAQASEQPDIGLHAAQFKGMPDLHPKIGQVLGQSQGLLECLCSLQRLNALQGTHFRLWLRHEQGELKIFHRSALPASSRGYDHANQFTAFKIVGIVRQFLGAQWRPDYLGFAFNTRPTLALMGQTRERRVLTGCPDSFVPLALMSEPIAEPAQLEVVGSSLDRVKQVVEIFLEHDKFSLAFVAQLFGVSERTLQRLFQAEGRSFRTYLNERRLTRARALLDQGLAVHQVAQRLGYSEPANFTRAMRRFSAQTPSQYRQGG
ncbi:helix-turn-helix transcriptional regulator [Ferrimonas balearica]|uniref:helix-turn-helix transcriptional regulator n=1 Tax=Ferrimonas balearica TaxID=44012 RepID=UPI001C99D286|nr:helix-turn-helix transcriptional regulator [Ferrimonas balearica]MBY5993234.1 AraC family transcriptional regulator [Ferrimonas balearica]